MWIQKEIDKVVSDEIERRMGSPETWWKLVHDCEELLKRFDIKYRALLAELADAADSKPAAFGRQSSNLW